MDFEFIEDICTDPISAATLNCTDASELKNRGGTSRSYIQKLLMKSINLSKQKIMTIALQELPECKVF